MSNRTIAQLLNCAPNTIKKYRKNASEQSLNWQKVNELNDEQVKKLLVSSANSIRKRQPDWHYIHSQMKMAKVTLMLLWEEYCLDNSDNAYCYSSFSHYYRKHVSTLDLSMRQVHRAGEVVFVDYAGTRIPYYSTDGTKYHAEIFVGVLGASKYTFAVASASQKMPDWIEAHNQMYRFFGGVPKLTVPDNLKSAVITPGAEPKLNRSYREMAAHYGTVIVPARVARPKDKSHGEIGVQIVTRWITAALRHQKFFSLKEINDEISTRIIKLNDKPFKKLPGCRREIFEQLDKPLLAPVPEANYEPTAQWAAEQKVRSDYHVVVDHHYYSVPHYLVGSTVEARITHTIVEIFSSGQRVVSHIRSLEKGGTTTLTEHQPIAHRKYAEQTPDYFQEWAQGIGEATVQFVDYQLNKNPHFLPGIRICTGLKKLESLYGAARLELACARSARIGSQTLKSVKSILKRKLDQVEEAKPSVQGQLPMHYNVRGPHYYTQKV
jgi:transposase